MKTKEQMLIDGIKAKLAKDSSSGAKNNAGIEYADWYYRQYGLGYENEKACILKMVDILSLDFNTCMYIQRPVYSFHKMCEIKGIATEAIYSHHNIASQAIQKQLLDQEQKQQEPVLVSKTLKKAPAHKRLTDDDFIVDIGGRNKAIDCSGIQSKHSKDTSIEGSLQISQAVCNVLSLRETKDKNPYIANNIKVIDLSNCNINGWDTNFFSSRLAHLDLDLDALYIQNNPLSNRASEQLLCYKIASNSSVTHTLRHIDLSNCNLGYNGAIHFSRISEHWHRLESANLSNNVIDDRGAMAIANAFFYGKFPQLKSLDFHGNQISPEGYGYFAKVLETVPRQIQTQDIAITMEVHAEQRTAWEFVKHAFSYIAEAYSKKQVIADKELLVALYGEGEYAVCKKALADASHGIAVGMVKSMANPVVAKTVQVANKIPHKYAKVAATTGVFAYGFKDAVVDGKIFTPELVKCISLLNKKAGFYHVGTGEYTDNLIGDTHDTCDIM